MRVGVLTFHQALNYGAVLQAYALQKCLFGMGVDCDVVDYRCAALTKNYSTLHLDRPTPRSVVSDIAHAPGRIARHRQFAAFRGGNLKLSVRTYDRTTIHEADPAYDSFVVGSDQVWNPRLTGEDTTYLLDFCAPEKRISYAASLGQAGTTGEYDELFREQLMDYRAISVREQDGRDYLISLLKREASWVLDPVFLMPVREWNELAARPAVKRPYMFVYCLHETGLFTYAEQVRRSTGMDIIYVPSSMRIGADGMRVTNPSVSELLGLIQSADLVLTDSFHVLAFSIIFGRDFRVQLKTQLSGLNSRVTSLLSVLGLEGQIWEPETSGFTMVPVASRDDAERALQGMVDDSLGFLQAALGVGASR